MQSSKKATKCATPLILNSILPKCHPETREWGYYKSEGIKSNFHLYKGVEGQDSSHTHTINWVMSDLPISVRITSLARGELRGLLSLKRQTSAQTHTTRQWAKKVISLVSY